jgi:hypothetical protein
MYKSADSIVEQLDAIGSALGELALTYEDDSPGDRRKLLEALRELTQVIRGYARRASPTVGEPHAQTH